MSETNHPQLPLSSNELDEFHETVASHFEDNIHRLGETIALFFGDAATTAAFSVCFDSKGGSSENFDDFIKKFPKHDWRDALDRVDLASDIDVVNLTGDWRLAAEYAGQGLVPARFTLGERETFLRDLIAKSAGALRYGPLLLGHRFDYVWHGVQARGAIDFGIGRVTLDGLCLLSRLSLQIIRNAVSSGALNPDALQTVSPDEALAWLARRREFIPSRWRDMTDDQYPLFSDEIDDTQTVEIPQSAEGDRFLPEQVMRLARNRRECSIAIGAKGEEEIFHDFYDALKRLKELALDPDRAARWRRPNTAGNWGSVRARGAWMAVDRAEIDRQIVARKKELGL